MKAVRSAVALALALAVSIGAPAHAQTQYRYWSFWQANSAQSEAASWNLASVGAGSIPAAQGLVQGWRFITAGVEVSADLAPRIAPDFSAICGQSPAPAAGNVQVAIVIDYGLESDLDAPPPAPRGLCVELAEGEPSTMAIAKAADVRENAGFVCGLDQIPATGCGEEIEVSTSKLNPPREDESNTAASSSTDATWDVIANIVTTILGVIVFVMAWRRMINQKAAKRRRQTDSQPDDSVEPGTDDSTR